MLDDATFKIWSAQLNLSDEAHALVKQVRESEPVRRVGGGGPNVCGRYPSLKMGKTIQFESHKVELPAIEAYETDDDVLEFYDQPFELELSFKSASGRKRKTKHVPDFLVLRQTSVRFEEWKPEKRLEELAQKNPNHYYQDEDGIWHNPPAEEAAAHYGLAYQLHLDSEINWIEYRNWQFLKSYRDGSYPINEATQSSLIDKVAVTPGVTISELSQAITPATLDDIHALIALKLIYTNLQAVSLTEPSKIQLFRDQATAEACCLISPPSETPPDNSQPSTSPPTTKAWEIFLQASPDDLRIANQRYRTLKLYLADSSLQNTQVSKRTLRRWKSNFEQAQLLHSWGYIGLLPQHHAKGNHSARLSSEAWEFIDQVIATHYDTLQQKGKMSVYGILVREWEKAKRSDRCPSHVTFYQYLNHTNQYQHIKKRQGGKAAYQRSSFYWELSLTTPRHGDRPFEICHIDHTELDIELVCSRTGENLGRPWATVLLDAFSRRILAVYLSFERPSYRACMMALRICVQRFERFPETIVVDRGSEFDSVYFETLLATFNCTKKQRPTARPRFGSILERLFGTTHSEFLYTLRGNTQSTKNVRQVTRKTSPQTQAVWNLGELYIHLCRYSYDVYEQLSHPTLGRSPRAAFLAGIEQTGERPQQRVVSDFNFHILTFPSTAKGTAKVQKTRGICVNYLHYWAIDDGFLNPAIEGRQVPVRYDPFDASTAYAYVKGRWVRCISEHQALFQGRSEQEIKVISAEIRREKQLHNRTFTLRAKTIASYLEAAEASEAVQLQRLKDLATGDVHQQIQPQNLLPEAGLQAEGKHQQHRLVEASIPFEIDLSQIKPYATEELWT